MLIPSIAHYIHNKLVVLEYVDVDPVTIARGVENARKGDYEYNTHRDIEEEPVLPAEAQDA